MQNDLEIKGRHAYRQNFHVNLLVVILLVVILIVSPYKTSVANEEKFFLALGEKVRKLRTARNYSQEDMMTFGFSVRHWQQVEAGRPITVTTLLRICEVFEVTMAQLVRGLDAGIYEAPDLSFLLQKRSHRQKAK